MEKVNNAINRMINNPPEFTDQEIEAMKKLWPDWETRRSFFGYHLKRIIARKANPAFKLTLYHLTAQVAIKKYIQQELSHQ